VVLGTVALEDPALVRELAASHPDAIVVGLDGRGGDVAVRGWTEASGRTVVDVAASFAGSGVAALVVTEIGRDGTLEGPDVDGLAAVLAATDIDVIASGGVSSVADLRALRQVEVGGRNLAGAIVGRALYEYRFSLTEALTVSR
jgi:phosphoribosylformimino-5-aminoimidazole carboxamide ribotide isomerase